MLNMQQGKIQNVWHVIKNGQACEKSENTTKRRGVGGWGQGGKETDPEMTQIIQLLFVQKGIVTTCRVVKKVVVKK